MSQAIILAKQKKPVGVYTQKKLAWAQVEKLEGKEPTSTCADLDNLVMMLKTKVIIPSYARVCNVLREEGRVALYRTEEDIEANVVEYTMFLFEMNVMVNKKVEEDENNT